MEVTSGPQVKGRAGFCPLVAAQSQQKRSHQKRKSALKPTRLGTKALSRRCLRISRAAVKGVEAPL